MNNNVKRFLLTLFLGGIGSFIVNHSTLKPEGYKSRTELYYLTHTSSENNTKNLIFRY